MTINRAKSLMKEAGWNIGAEQYTVYDSNERDITITTVTRFDASINGESFPVIMEESNGQVVLFCGNIIPPEGIGTPPGFQAMKLSERNKLTKNAKYNPGNTRTTDHY